MRWLKCLVIALVVGACVGCGDSSSGSKEEKQLPPKRLPGSDGKKQ